MKFEVRLPSKSEKTRSKVVEDEDSSSMRGPAGTWRNDRNRREEERRPPASAQVVSFSLSLY